MRNLVVISLSVAVFSLAGYFFFINEPRSKEFDQREEIGAPASDPIEIFMDAFSAGDYKVTILSDDSSMEAVFYYEKGTLVRFGDSVGVSGNPKSYLLFTRDGLVSVKGKERTYRYALRDPAKIENARTVMHETFIVMLLAKAARENDFSWVREGENFVSENIWNLEVSDGEEIPVAVKIGLDPAGLINKIYIRPEGGEWEYKEIAYEPITDFPSLLRIPEGYTEELTTAASSL